jgi:uncharacterized cupin superfamily protein
MVGAATARRDDMVADASMQQGAGGLKPAGDGWFVVNARDAEWIHNQRFGAGVTFEGGTEFPQLGVNIQVLWPGQPNAYYHGEDYQEDFLILSGECLLLIEGEERRLRAWDFVHCPPNAQHVLVGAGDGPCAFIGIGARRAGAYSVLYPVSELALSHGAGVTEETTDPDVAYADAPKTEPGPYRSGLPGDD